LIKLIYNHDLKVWQAKSTRTFNNTFLDTYSHHKVPKHNRFSLWSSRTSRNRQL